MASGMMLSPWGPPMAAHWDVEGQKVSGSVAPEATAPHTLLPEKQHPVGIHSGASTTSICYGFTSFTSPGCSAMCERRCLQYAPAQNVACTQTEEMEPKPSCEFMFPRPDALAADMLKRGFYQRSGSIEIGVSNLAFETSRSHLNQYIKCCS